jgi:Bardet-Biedl syndrome 5 protein
MSKNAFTHLDRDIKFDVVAKLVQMQPGEEEIDLIPQIEDTKGKIGEKGEMLVTNMRLLWISKDKANTNLSIYSKIYFIFFEVWV